ncbi:MAG: hypothetical protein V4650_02040 [Pseudomonadota bacterium]
MNIKPLISGLLLSVGLLMTTTSMADSGKNQPGQPVTAAEAGSKANQKALKRKPAKRYSKATLSAFKSLSTTAQAAPQISSDPLNPPLMVQDLGLSLRSGESANAPVSGLALQDSNEPDPSQNLLAEFTAENNELGSESVSVIDRIADKPKAQPIVSGPLRVRVQEKGVRASVQIPLTLD